MSLLREKNSPIQKGWTDEELDEVVQNCNWTENELLLAEQRKAYFHKEIKKTLIAAEKKRNQKLLKALYKKTVSTPKEKNAIVATKLFMIFIFLNCIIVETYSMWAMYQLQDLSALYALIAAVITESISFGIYCCKSYFETKESEKIRLEQTKLELSSGVDVSTIEELEDEEEYFEAPTVLEEEDET